MKICFLVLDKVFDTGLTSMLDIFATANEIRQAEGSQPPLEFTLIGVRRHIHTALGFKLAVNGVDRAADADWIVVPALNTKQPAALAAALDRPDVQMAKRYLRDWHAQGIGIAAACTGTFVVADSGLLDGAQATTSWGLAPFFRQRFPLVELHESRIISAAGSVVTAAAMMGHMDLALWFVRNQSPTLAATVARFMLIDDRLSQAEYIIPDFLAASDPLVSRFERWCRGNLAEGFDLQAAAGALNVHARTLQRRLDATLGKSPLAFFQDVRIEHARRLMAEGASLEVIADEVGYADGATLGNLLRRKLGHSVRSLRARSR